MTFTKKGMSVKVPQKQIGHKRYNTVWSLIHRIRAAMGRLNDLYGLEGMIELDKGYFEKAIDEGEKQRHKRGRGSQRQSNVAVMAESTRLEDPGTGRTDSHVPYFKMKVLEIHKKDGVNQLVSSFLDGKSIVFSDKSPSYMDIED